MIKGDPLPEIPADAVKKYGPDEVRRLGYRLWLEIATEILEFDLDHCSNRKGSRRIVMKLIVPCDSYQSADTMMYKLLLESRGKRDQSSIVDYLSELIEKVDAEPNQTREFDSLVAVQHLLSLMIRAVDLPPKTEQSAPSQTPLKMETSAESSVPQRKSTAT